MPGSDDRYGVFSAEPQTVWLTEPGADRKMMLLQLFTFTDAAGRVWDAPSSHKVDGASIPRALWTLVGSPYTGEYRRASILHDVNCDRYPQDGPERRAGDEMFYAACRAGGCGRLEAKLLFLGVRLGSIWASKGLWTSERDVAVKLEPSPQDLWMQAEFERLGRDLVALDAASAVAKSTTDTREDPSSAIDQVDAVLLANGLTAPTGAESATSAAMPP